MKPPPSLGGGMKFTFGRSVNSESLFRILLIICVKKGPGFDESSLATFLSYGQLSLFPTRQGAISTEQKALNRWQINKIGWKIGGIHKHVLGKTAEWSCTLEDGVPCLSFSAQIPLIWADNSAQNQRSVLPGWEMCQMSSYLHMEVPPNTNRHES